MTSANFHDFGPLLPPVGSFITSIHRQIKPIFDPSRPLKRCRRLKWMVPKAKQRINTQQKVVIGSTVLPFSAAVYTQVLNYLRMCLIYNAGVVPHFDMLRDVYNEAPKVSQYIVDFITSADKSKRTNLKELIQMNENFLVAQQDTAQAQCLLQLIGCTPNDQWLNIFQPRMSWLRSLLKHTKEGFREVASQLYGLVASTFHSSR